MGLFVLRCPDPLPPELELPDVDAEEDEVDLRAPLLRAALCERLAIKYFFLVFGRAGHGGLGAFVACGLNSRSHRAAKSQE